MERILMVQPSLQPPGGGNGVAAWMVQSLSRRGRVTVLSWVPLQLDEVDAYYGTNLRAANLESRLIQPWIPGLLRLLRVPHELFKLHLLMREARRIAADYDRVCSANNELDLGCRAVQYVHYPWNYHPRPDCHHSWYANPILRAVLLTYYQVCSWLSGYRREAVPGNLTLVNSDWTGRLYQSIYGPHPYTVLHPPALGSFPEAEWKPRRNAFLSIGRISPCKEWEKLIVIVGRLRGMGHEVELTLAGSRDDPAYGERIRAEIARRGSWVRLLQDLSRAEMVAEATSHRYGLHGMTREHYGMAVAELILGGCIPFVPDDGGQVEITRDPRLEYASVEDAVEKIDRVLRSEPLQAELRAVLAERRSHLGVERFLREFEVALQA
ncbi:MAG: glycosyltransferase [Candidatus Eremiobacterota bacterium]